MYETGIVEKISNNRAAVRIKRSSACGKSCASCSAGCRLGFISVEIENTAGAQPGDMVLLSTETKKVLGAGLAVYIVPLLAFIGVYFIAYFFEKNELLSALASFCGMAAAFAAVHLWQKNRKKEFLPVMVKVLDRNGEN